MSACITFVKYNDETPKIINYDKLLLFEPTLVNSFESIDEFSKKVESIFENFKKESMIKANNYNFNILWEIISFLEDNNQIIIQRESTSAKYDIIINTENLFK